MAAAVVLPALPTPQSVTPAELADYGAQVVAWAEQVDDIGQVREAADKWAAITEYVRRSSREGVAGAEATLRRLEVRVGQLLGPATRDHDRTAGSTSVVPDIERHARSDLRDLAEHADVVEQVIAESTDAEPPSRRKVLAAIRDHKDRTRTRTPAEVEFERGRRDREDIEARAQARRQFNASTGNALFCLAVLADVPAEVTDFATHYGPPGPSLTTDDLKAAARTLDQLINEWSHQ